MDRDSGLEFGRACLLHLSWVENRDFISAHGALGSSPEVSSSRSASGPRGMFGLPWL